MKAIETITSVTFISKETVKTELMIAALNDLEMKTTDILNAYVQAPVTEKVWTVLGP